MKNSSGLTSDPTQRAFALAVPWESVSERAFERLVPGRNFNASQAVSLIFEAAVLALDHFAQFDQQAQELGRGIANVMLHRSRASGLLFIAI
jgi:hypothetical protein